MAVDHPLVAVEHGSRAEERRVGAGNVGLCHGEERPRPPRHEWLQELRLLVGGAELVQDFRVAGVGRLAAEDELGPVRAPDLLVHAGVVEEPLTRPACLRRHVRRPQPGRARLLLQRPDELLGGIVLAVEELLVRVHVRLHERPVLLAARHVCGREE